jgi:hypothetical protein
MSLSSYVTVVSEHFSHQLPARAREDMILYDTSSCVRELASRKKERAESFMGHIIRFYRGLSTSFPTTEVNLNFSERFFIPNPTLSYSLLSSVIIVQSSPPRHPCRQLRRPKQLGVGLPEMAVLSTITPCRGPPSSSFIGVSFILTHSHARSGLRLRDSRDSLDLPWFHSDDDNVLDLDKRI